MQSERTVTLAQSAKRKVIEIEKKVENLLDRIVDSSSDSVVRAYEQRITALEREKLVMAEKLQKQHKPQRSFDQMFELAIAFLSNPCKLWDSEHLEDKRTALKLTFEDRLIYQRNKGVRTPKTSIVFRALNGICAGKKVMAVTVGFEPTLRVNVNTLSKRAP